MPSTMNLEATIGKSFLREPKGFSNQASGRRSVNNCFTLWTLFYLLDEQRVGKYNNHETEIL